MQQRVCKVSRETPELVFERFAEIQTLYLYGYMKFPERCNSNTWYH